MAKISNKKIICLYCITGYPTANDNDDDDGDGDTVIVINSNGFVQHQSF
jgi:hypothetical protein